MLAIAAAVTLGVLAFAAKGQLSEGTPLPDGRVASGLSGSQANALSRRANNELLAGSICAGVGVGLGATAVVVW